jgi:predicted nucleic acid-binding protein
VIIVDTTIWIDYLTGIESPEAHWLDASLTTTRLGLTDLILCEVLQGVRDGKAFERVRRDLQRFEVFNGGGSHVAIAAARNYRSLRSRGITVRKTIDCMIATFCIAKGHALLHHDTDYHPFERHLGLAVIHP